MRFMTLVGIFACTACSSNAAGPSPQLSQPGPSSGPAAAPSAEPCPTRLADVEGKACGQPQSCGDPERPGFSIACVNGQWRAEESHTPPCCKK